MCDGDGNFIRDVDSSFAVNLKSLAWVPGIQTQCTADPNGNCQFYCFEDCSICNYEVKDSAIKICLLTAGKVIYHRENVRDVANKMFINAPIMEKMLAHHVTYLNVHMSPQSEFGTFSGINQVCHVDSIYF